MFIKKYFSRFSLSIILTIIILNIILAFYTSLKIGYIYVDEADIISGLAEILGFNNFNKVNEEAFEIIFSLRLPRTLLALDVGMGLTLSGIVMQAILKNNLADPYILGISSGASLGVVCATFLGLGVVFGSQFIGVCAFIGAFFVSILIIMLVKFDHEIKHNKLLLSGIAIGSICTSLSGVITYLGQNKEGMEAVTYWLMGSIANAKIENALLLFFLVFLVFIYFISQTRILNLMLVGSEVAITLGVNLNKYLKKYLLFNGILIGFIVFNSGMIGFIGLLIPHIFRILLGVNHKRFLPVAVLGGGLVTIIVDIISRIIISGIDIPLGVTFAILGTPVFIYLLIKKNYGFTDS